MADIASRSSALGGYKTTTAASTRVRVSKAVTNNNDGTALVTLTVTFDMGEGYMLTMSDGSYAYNLTLAIGSVSTTKQIRSSQDLWEKHKTYTYTISLTVPLGSYTSLSANLSGKAIAGYFAFSATDQGGDSIDSLPLGELPVTFSSLSNFEADDVSIPCKITKRTSWTTYDIAVKVNGVAIKSWTGLTLDSYTSINISDKIDQIFAAIPNANSAICTVTVTTKSDGRVVGTASRDCTCTIPASYKPSMNGFAWTDSHWFATANGVSVQSNSSFNLTMSGAAASKGATLKAQKISYGGMTVDGPTTSARPYGLGTGLQTATATVTDSRGRTASRTAQRTILPWRRPQLSSVKVERCDSGGAINPAGDHVKLSCYISSSSLKVGGAEKNGANLTVWSTDRDGGNRANNQTINNPGVTSKSISLIFPGIFALDQSYIVYVAAFDIFSNAASITPSWPVATAEVLMDWNKNEGVGFGKMHEQGAVDIGGDGLYVDNIKLDPDELRTQRNVFHSIDSKIYTFDEASTMLEEGTYYAYEDGVATGWINVYRHPTTNRNMFILQEFHNISGGIWWREGSINSIKTQAWTELHVKEGAKYDLEAMQTNIGLLNSYKSVNGTSVTWMQVAQAIIEGMPSDASNTRQGIASREGELGYYIAIRANASFGACSIFGYSSSLPSVFVMSGGYWTQRRLSWT